MDFHAPADLAKQSDGQFAAKVFAEFVQAAEHLQIAVRGDIQQFIGKKIEAELLEQSENAPGRWAVEQAGPARVNHVERDADGDGFAVPDLEVGKLLQLVGRPVAEIEWTRRTQFERIAAGCNVVEMQFGTALNQPLHGGWFKRGELFRVTLQFREKFRIADAGDLYSLDVAATLIPRRERGEQVEIVDDGVRRRERADEILFAERVDAVFHTDAGIGLAQGRGRQAHVADAAMRGGGGETSGIQQRPAADGNQVRVPVEMMAVNVRMDFGDMDGGILGAFTAFDDHRRTYESDIAGMSGKIIFNPASKIGASLRERFVEDDECLGQGSTGARSTGITQRILQDEIVRSKNVFGEINAELPADLDGALNHRHDRQSEFLDNSFRVLFEAKLPAVLLHDRTPQREWPCSNGLFPDLLVFRNAHAIKRAIDKGQRDDKEENTNSRLQTLIGHRHRDFRGEQAEERGEFDDGIHRHRAGVLERIAHGVADDGGGMKRGAFLFQVHFHNLFSVVPGAAGIGHENGLEQAEERDTHEVADEEIGVEERQGEREGKNDDEDVNHAFLRINGADFDDPFTVGDRGLGLVEVEMFLDEHDATIGAGDDRLGAGAGEPVDHRAAHQQAENDFRTHQAQHLNHLAVRDGIIQQQDDAKNHRSRTDNGRADEHRFGGGLERVPRTVPLFEFELGVGKVGFEPEILLNFRGDVRHRFNPAQLVNRLRVVRDRPETVHGDDDRRHGQKTERDQAEGEDGRGELELRRHEREQVGVLREQIGNEHQRQDDQSHPERAEIAGHETGQDVQRRPAVAGGIDHLADVARVGADKNFGEFHDQRAGEHAAGHDAGQRPPKVPQRRTGGVLKITEQQFAGDKGNDDGENGSEPDQIRQRRFPVEILSAGVTHAVGKTVHVKRSQRGQHHQALNCENPDDELAAQRGRGCQRQGQERDQRHAGHAVGFKSVRRRADRVARVVAGAIGDDAGIFRIVFRQVENDFHQVRADVGDFGEDAAADAQRGRAERFADGKADEAGPGQFPRQEQEDAQHAEQFHANQQQPDAHAGLQWNRKCFQPVAPERGERGAAIGGGVDADAKPRHAIAAEDAQHRAGKNYHTVANQFSMSPGGIVPGQPNKVVNHAQRD